MLKWASSVIMAGIFVGGMASGCGKSAEVALQELEGLKKAACECKAKDKDCGDKSLKSFSDWAEANKGGVRGGEEEAAKFGTIVKGMTMCWVKSGVKMTDVMTTMKKLQ